MVAFGLPHPAIAPWVADLIEECAAFPGETETNGDFDVRRLATKMDALLDLLESTADALAAEWDQRSKTVALEADGQGGGFEPTIQ